MVSARDLQSRAAALLADTGPLHSAAGLGFVVDKGVVDQALASFDSTVWSVVDARALDNQATRAALVAALKQGKAIALVVGVHPPLAALAFAQSLAERRSVADLGELITQRVPAGTSLVVLVEGIDEHSRLPRQLQSVDFWEFWR